MILWLGKTWYLSSPSDSLLFYGSEHGKPLTFQPSCKLLFSKIKNKIKWVIVDIGLVSIGLVFMVVLE